jgi:ADP-ribosylglycohydrolase
MRGAIVAGSMLVILLVAWVVFGWRDAARELDTLRNQLQAERSARIHEIQIAEKASKDYQHELEALRAARGPAPVVRLCRPAVPAAPTAVTAGGADAGPAPSGVGLSGPTGGDQPGPDIGGDLDAIAARCDALTAQLRALQGWERAIQDEPAR